MTTSVPELDQDLSDLERLHAQLEQKVRERTALLRATLDATADGILVVDTRGMITDYNDAFAKMWGIPESILAAHDDEAAIAAVLDQVADPAGFRRGIREVYADPKAKVSDTIDFKDGRVFERRSQPQIVDGQTVGRVWTFRDITAQRRQEEQIKRHMEELETLNATMVGRELKMVELKEEIDRLKYKKNDNQ
jgi:PAS domain S-box-containing protein